MPPVFSIMYIPLLDWSADNFWQVFVKIRKGTSHRGSQWQLFFHDIPLDFFMCKTGMVSNSKNWCQYWMRESYTLAGPSSLIETITVERRHTLLHLWCRPLQSVPFSFVLGFLDLLVLNDIRVYFFEKSVAIFEAKISTVWWLPFPLTYIRSFELTGCDIWDW